MSYARVAFGVLLAYFWVMMILFGSIVFETFVIYPDIFRDPPSSLETALAFMKPRGPANFYPPLGFLSWVTGAAAIGLTWKVREARGWVMASVAMILCEGLFSMVYFWPRNTIMFIEGARLHSADLLRQTAFEFERLHWARLAFNAAGSAFVLVGLLKFYGALARPAARASS